ncbi:PREDICTED: elongation of very long chain fatty acids protein 6-like, partial [Rhagoletis zephyria]|uniref:elongation of very long chain fatty acids protein 6-like n=1 Tax=Rhagoletis zephyria TaxID=28612 RepID=UPI00081159D2
MSTRTSPLKLKLPLTLWNIALALFSITGTIRTWPEMAHVLTRFGFHHSVCANTFHKEVPISSFWTWLFILSKAPELIDTVFVVLRKQKLIFLHWYHHATVLIFTWYAYADEASTGRWYCTMNYGVHAVMYSYYALRALGVRIPRQLAMCITISQIAQMVMGTFVTFYAFYAKSNGRQCDMSFSTLYAGIAIYISYFILFAQFFIASYLVPKKPKKTTEAKKT